MAQPRFKLFVYLSGLLWLLPIVCLGAVFGDGDPSNGVEDSRAEAPAQLLKAVGTVFCDGGLRGTAAHIGLGSKPAADAPSIIITAAHVLFDTQTGLPFADCSYRPENRRLKSVAFAEISPHSYQPNTDDKMRQSETDVVFVALRRPLQQKPLYLALPQQAQAMQLLGYNPSNERITISGQCHAYRSSAFVSEHLLLHNCDAESGSSGGPLLGQAAFDESQGVQNTVVAIHGGTLSNSGSYGPGARAQPERWINQARKVDTALLQRLQNFIAYLGKGSAD